VVLVVARVVGLVHHQAARESQGWALRVVTLPPLTAPAVVVVRAQSEAIKLGLLVGTVVQEKRPL
jgi:hypothetical protein